MKLTKSHRTTILIIAITCVLALITSALIFFNVNISKLFQKNSINSIQEVQSLYMKSLHTIFDDELSMVEAQARYFDKVDFNDINAVKKTITGTKGIGHFKTIAVATKDGTCINYTGKHLANVKNKFFFAKTLITGKNYVSDSIELDESLEPVMTFCAPVVQNTKTEGLVIGTISYNVLKDQFSTPTFNGTSYNYLISKNGNIIMCNKEKRKSIYNIDFFNYLVNSGAYEDEEFGRMKLDIINNRAGTAIINGNLGKKTYTYSPLGINEWYIVTVVPMAHIYQQQADVNMLVLSMLITIAIALIIFLLILNYLMKSNRNMEKANDRLTIATNQNQSVIFEFDMQKQSVEFSGDTQFIFGTDKKSFSADFIMGEYYKRIHEDDKSVTDTIHSAVNGGIPDFSTEFRYLSFSNKYIWLRMTGTVIHKENETPAKFIGSITNVNAQVMHEHELKSMAESDKLTGLLNKSAMEQKAQKYLEQEQPPKNTALFIVDLDNFKAVNDKLGHLIGDMAILDAAKKLSLIFSEKDLISRFGGDEFCIMLRLSEDISPESVKRIVKDKAKNLCATMKEVYFDEKTSVKVSASVGIALYPDHGDNYEDLFKNADTALYHTKQNGKNGFSIFKPEA